MRSAMLLWVALSTAWPPTRPSPRPAESIGCSTSTGARRLGYSIGALLLVYMAIRGASSKHHKEPLSEEQREKFRNLGRDDD